MSDTLFVLRLNQEEQETIWGLDLQAVKFKLAHGSGEGWTAAFCDDVETQYKAFLTLIRRYPGKQFVPTEAIDTFWHYHILHTIKYREDCQKAFGFFLDHNPHLGLHNDFSVLKEAALETQRLLREDFGVNIFGITMSQCGPSGCIGCGVNPQPAPDVVMHHA